MNIVFCTDNQFSQVEVSMCSLFETNDASNCKVFLFTTEIMDEQEQRFQNIAKHYGGQYETIIVDEKLLPFLQKIDVKEFNKKNYKSVKNVRILPNASYYRMLIPYYLPNEERCLYLDTDVVMNRNIEEYYNINLNGIAFAGQKNKNNNEILSGNIIINISYWKENNFIEKFISTVYERYDNDGRIDDQHILNIVAKGNLMEFDDNFMAGTNIVMSRNDLSEYYILHYFGAHKPWLLKDSRKWRGTEYWWKYYDKVNELLS